MAAKTNFRFPMLAAALAAAGLFFAVSAAAGQAAVEASKPASARVELKVVIPNVLRLRTLHAPSRVEVTAGDVERGFVAVSGYEIEIDANLRAGYSVLATLAAGPFASADVQGLAAPLHIAGSEGSAWVPYSPNHRRQMQVSYRLELRAGAAPGSYASPVLLALAGS